MTGACCLVCTQPTPDRRDFHEACWLEAKRHMDALADMARRKFGYNFSLMVRTDAFGNPSVVPEARPASLLLPIQGLPPPPPEDIRVLEEAVAAEQEFLSSPCLCEKDADGRCPKCIEIISSFVRDTAKLMKEFKERQSALTRPEEACDICGKEYADYIIAKTVREMFSVMLEYAGSEFKDTVLAMVEAMKAQMGKGVTKWPLLERAMMELLEKMDRGGEVGHV